jgi:hypothetical protein
MDPALATAGRRSRRTRSGGSIWPPRRQITTRGDPQAPSPREEARRRSEFCVAPLRPPRDHIQKSPPCVRAGSARRRGRRGRRCRASFRCAPPRVPPRRSPATNRGQNVQESLQRRRLLPCALTNIHHSPCRGLGQQLGPNRPEFLIDDQARPFDPSSLAACLREAPGYSMEYDAAVRAQSITDAVRFLQRNLHP